MGDDSGFAFTFQAVREREFSAAVRIGRLTSDAGVSLLGAVSRGATDQEAERMTTLTLRVDRLARARRRPRLSGLQRSGPRTGRSFLLLRLRHIRLK